MDDREARLQKEIELRRAELVASAEALRRSVVETFDPREKLRRHPLAGVLVSVGAGIILGMLQGRRRAEPVEKARRVPPLIAVAAGLLPGMLPALIGPLLSLIGRSSEHKPPRARKRDQSSVRTSRGSQETLDLSGVGSASDTGLGWPM